MNFQIVTPAVVCCILFLLYITGDEVQATNQASASAATPASLIGHFPGTFLPQFVALPFQPLIQSFRQTTPDVSETTMLPASVYQSLLQSLFLQRLQQAVPSSPPLMNMQSSEQQPVEVVFRTHSSPMRIKQVHMARAELSAPKVTKSEDEPHRAVHQVARPIIQEVREIIQPYRRVIQVVKPVQEEIRTIVAKGEEQISNGSNDKALKAPVSLDDGLNANSLASQVSSNLATMAPDNVEQFGSISFFGSADTGKLYFLNPLAAYRSTNY